MVPRYARAEMTALWEPEARYRIWFEIEAHATQKLADIGVVPDRAAKALWAWVGDQPYHRRGGDRRDRGGDEA
jgi:adenylosuccinate lyase